MTQFRQRGWHPQNGQSQFHWKRIDGTFTAQDAAELVTEIQDTVKHVIEGNWTLTHVLLKPVYENENQQVEFGQMFQ